MLDPAACARAFIQTSPDHRREIPTTAAERARERRDLPPLSIPVTDPQLAAGVDVARIKPGQDLPVNVTLTIDHGGQSWLMLSCADSIQEGRQPAMSFRVKVRVKGWGDG